MKTLGLYMIAGLGLSACASGISGGTTANTNPSDNPNNIVTQYPVETAMLNIYTKQRSARLVGTVDNQSVSADIEVTPKGRVLFNNKAVQSAEINTINKVNDRITAQSVAINYFTLNPLVFHGFTDSTGKYSLSNQTTTIPKMVTVGDSSKFITETVYADSSMGKKTGKYEQDWSLTQETNNTAWLCITTSENLLLTTSTEDAAAECYKINSQGDILASKVVLNQPSANATKTVTLVSQ
ncbi:hypothetical protein AAIR29_12750 [Psychrobacter sp. FBL11]|uniref:Lipoprotein n=1 Tax=Psychrobacter saeujeotis TaxID=3143436 RepID=A0ABU9XEQ4_9GAMM|nr:hypothetical protein [uncultured Psychrobacter sp.]